MTKSIIVAPLLLSLTAACATLPSAAPERHPTDYLPAQLLTVSDGGAGQAQLLFALPSGAQPAAVLVDRATGRSLEAHLEARAAGHLPPASGLHGLLAESGAEIEAVRIEHTPNRLFVGTALLRRAGRVEEIDLRAGDAVLLALGHGAPIFLSAEAAAEGQSLGIDWPAPPVVTESCVAEPAPAQRGAGFIEAPQAPAPTAFRLARDL